MPGTRQARIFWSSQRGHIFQAAVAATLPAMGLSDLAEQGLTMVIRASLSPGIETTPADLHGSTHGHRISGLLRLDELESQLDFSVKKVAAFLNILFNPKITTFFAKFLDLGVLIILLPPRYSGNLLTVLAASAVQHAASPPLVPGGP